MGIGLYTITIPATTNSAAYTEDAFIEIDNVSDRTITVKRIFASFNGNGPGVTVSSANTFRLRIYSCTTLGVGGSASFGGIIPIDQNVRPSSISNIYVKSGTTNYTEGTGNFVSWNLPSFNETDYYEYIATGYEEGFRVKSGYIFGIGASSSAASRPLNVFMEWEE